MSTIHIDDEEYVIETLPEEAKGILGLIRANNQKQSEAQITLGLANAAAETLGARLKSSLEGIKSIPAPRIKTSETGGNRKTRRAASTAKRNTSSKK